MVPALLPWQLSDGSTALATAAGFPTGPITSIKTLLDKAKHFHLAKPNALAMLAEVPTAISGWRDRAMSADVATGSGSPITVTGLLNDHTYDCTVWATNIVGQGLCYACANDTHSGFAN